MTVIERSALVPFSTQAMYDLVNDIEAYPQFMDGCVGAEVLRRDPDAVEARLDLAKGGIRYSFTTRNRLEPPHHIHLTLVEGPFRELRGQWTFLALGDAASKVSLHLEFEMSSRLLGLAAGKLFNSVANRLVDALVERAHAVHGPAR